MDGCRAAGTKFAYREMVEDANISEAKTPAASFRRRPVRFAVALLLVLVLIVPLVLYGVAMLIELFETFG